MIGPIVATTIGSINNIQLEWWSVPVMLIILVLLIALAWWWAK